MTEERIDIDYEKGFNLAYLLIKENEQNRYDEIIERYKLLNEARLNQLYLGLEAGKRQALNESLDLNKIAPEKKPAAIEQVHQASSQSRNDNYNNNSSEDKDREVMGKAEFKTVSKELPAKGEIIPDDSKNLFGKDVDSGSIRKSGQIDKGRLG